MSNFYKRGLSGLVYVLLFIAAICYSDQSFLFLTYFFGLASLREFMRLIRLRNYLPYLLFSGFTYVLLFERTLVQGELYLLVIAIFTLVFLTIDLYRQKLDVRSHTSKKFFVTLCYLCFSLFFLMYLPFYEGDYQPYLVLCLLILIWTNDSFAFIVGKNFGKHKLFPSISPKKTIEGFVGGILFSLIAAFIIYKVTGEFELIHWLVIGLMASILGTYGDLVESRFKRIAKVKDSGHIMPGHGGLLDRLDSLLFVAPFVYLYIHYIM